MGNAHDFRSVPGTGREFGMREADKLTAEKGSRTEVKLRAG